MSFHLCQAAVLFLFGTLLAVTHATSVPEDPSGHPEDPRVLSLFSIVRFDNEPCNATNNREGLCYTSSECTSRGGAPDGPCAKGFGVCCIIERSCGNMTNESVSYFVNPSYPNSDNGNNMCDFKIQVNNAEVCQIRLDFEDFSMAQPRLGQGQNQSFVCIDDTFTIAAPNLAPLGVPSLCGINSGQHLYIPVDASSGLTTVSLFAVTRDRERNSQLPPYSWRIRISQINCINRPHVVAPTGCLQYFTSRVGVIESFNFNSGEGHYVGNLDYAVCVRRYPDTCQVTFTTTAGSFELSRVSNLTKPAKGVTTTTTQSPLPPGGAPLFPNNQPGSRKVALHRVPPLQNGRRQLSTRLTDGPGLGNPGCDEPGNSADYLWIPEGDWDGDKATPSVDKYCGALLGIDGSVVSRTPGPILLSFRTDDRADDPAGEVGFRLSYMQGSTCG